MSARPLSLAARAAALLGAAVLGAHAAETGGLTLQAVEAEMETHSPRWVLEKHFACQPTRGPGYAKVAEGSAGWLALGAHLLSASDACYTENLQSALGEAMRHAPRRVLPLLGSRPTLAPERICLPFISDEQSLARQLREVRLSRKALEPVQEPEFVAARNACLDFIGRVEADLWAKLPVPPAPAAASAATPASAASSVPAAAAVVVTPLVPAASAALPPPVPASAASRAVAASAPASAAAGATPPPAASAASAPVGR